MGSKVSDNIMDVDTSSNQSQNTSTVQINQSESSPSPILNQSSQSSLKRCSSAPMINDINLKMNSSPSPTPTNREPTPFSIFGRARRFSASFSPQSPVPATTMGPRLTPRVSQLRQEEAVDVTNTREVAHEREIHSAMQMSQSWEDLNLVTDNLSCKSDTEMKPTTTPPTNCNSTNKMLPLNISLPAPTTSPASCSSPSPTRCGTLGRQCYSPVLPYHMGMAWKNTMSPSPTRKSFTTRRSLSPIAMRPSPLGPVKRKFDLMDESDKTEYLGPPTKRVNSFSGGGGLLIANHNNMTSSPLPGSLSSVGTPESLSSADSPSFHFNPIDSPPTPRNLVGMMDEPMEGNNGNAKTQELTATNSERNDA